MTLALTERQERLAADRRTYTGDPSARMTKAAELIKAGKGAKFVKAEAASLAKGGDLIHAALLEAGYGRRYAEHAAATFPGLLVSAGLLDEAAAAGVTPPAPAPTPTKTTKERETIQ